MSVAKYAAIYGTVSVGVFVWTEAEYANSARKYGYDKEAIARHNRERPMNLAFSLAWPLIPVGIVAYFAVGTVLALQGKPST